MCEVWRKEFALKCCPTKHLLVHAINDFHKFMAWENISKHAQMKNLVCLKKKNRLLLKNNLNKHLLTDTRKKALCVS